MIKTLTTIANYLTRAAAYLLPIFLAYRSGKQEQESDTQKEVLDNVKKANDAARDDAHDDELRKKYRRK